MTGLRLITLFLISFAPSLCIANPLIDGMKTDFKSFEHALENFSPSSSTAVGHAFDALYFMASDPTVNKNANFAGLLLFSQGKKVRGTLISYFRKQGAIASTFVDIRHKAAVIQFFEQLIPQALSLTGWEAHVRLPGLAKAAFFFARNLYRTGAFEAYHIARMYAVCVAIHASNFPLTSGYLEKDLKPLSNLISTLSDGELLSMLLIHCSALSYQHLMLQYFRAITCALAETYPEFRLKKKYIAILETELSKSRVQSVFVEVRNGIKSTILQSFHSGDFAEDSPPRKRKKGSSSRVPASLSPICSPPITASSMLSQTSAGAILTTDIPAPSLAVSPPTHAATPTEDAPMQMERDSKEPAG
jgi:hypothetical protein